MELYEKTFSLPSNGVFGGPREVTLRAMTTKEEKILLSTKDFTIFEKLVKSCCVEPKDLDIGLLHQADVMYLTYALREITFGNTYAQEVTCPNCNHKQEIDIDISEMEVDILDTEGLEEKLKVTLPVSGDELQLKMLSYGDNSRIIKSIKQKASKGRIQDPETYEFVVKLMEVIATKNGEAWEDQEEKKYYVENLNLRDLTAIQNALGNIKLGLDNSIVRTCGKCGDDMEVNGLICPEFFRPTK